MDLSELTHSCEFLGTLSVERNGAGEINLKMPQHRYDKANEIPIHQYGWGPFCKFHVDTSDYTGTAGVYIFTANHQIVYIGESVDIHSRIQSGYGNISPKNCFEGGQQTNCRINNAILETLRARGQVALWAKETPNRKQLETDLIDKVGPPWNFASPSTANEEPAVDEQPDADKSHSSLDRSSPSHSTGGKYGPLYECLESAEKDTLHFSFVEIEDILDASLPKSAREYSVWWNPTGHSHAEGWSELGWEAHPDVEERTVVFRKIN